MRIHILQHVPFEDEGNIGAWARANGFPVTRTLLYDNEFPPDYELYDWLVVMGGPMSVTDEADYPWLKQEKRAIAEAIAQRKTVIGICLGAQLIAEVLGGKVVPSSEKEYGWYPVEMLPAGAANPLFHLFPTYFTAFHWHGEMVTLPDDVTHIARSEGCETQAFLFSDRVIGMQFHLEITRPGINNLLKHCADDMTPGPFTQRTEVILSRTDAMVEVHGLLVRLLGGLANLPG
ncbi:MAG: GMP synthase (glutamine-hydrolyzing) [bacterium ADurb.Bin429]|nr:MAG: GMP synthase (glutamine-hydrolyzing) [bacterium ADurb.Bin429]